MAKVHENLRKARIDAGYKTSAEFCRVHDLVYPTYQGHENGQRGIPLRALEKYAELLNVSLDDLLERSPPVEKRGGLGDTGYRGDVWTRKKEDAPKTALEEVAGFLRWWAKTSPEAKKAIRDLILMEK